MPLPWDFQQFIHARRWMARDSSLIVQSVMPKAMTSWFAISVTAGPLALDAGQAGIIWASKNPLRGLCCFLLFSLGMACRLSYKTLWVDCTAHSTVLRKDAALKSAMLA